MQVPGTGTYIALLRTALELMGVPLTSTLRLMSLTGCTSNDSTGIAYASS